MSSFSMGGNPRDYAPPIAMTRNAPESKATETIFAYLRSQFAGNDIDEFVAFCAKEMAARGIVSIGHSAAGQSITLGDGVTALLAAELGAQPTYAETIPVTDTRYHGR